MCDEAQQLLTGEQLAEILQVHPKTIWLMARQGKLPRVVIGRAVRFDLEAVRQALDDLEKQRQVEKRR